MITDRKRKIKAEMAPLLSVQKSSEGELRRACVGGKGAREMAMAGKRMRSGEE